MFAPSHKAILERFSLDLALTKTPSLSIKSTSVPRLQFGYFCCVWVPISFAESSLFTESFHAWTAANEWADFPLAYIYYVVGPDWLKYSAILLFCMLIQHFTILSMCYDEVCFGYFFLYCLSLLHFKYIQIYNIYYNYNLSDYHKFFLDWDEILDVEVPALP